MQADLQTVIGSKNNRAAVGLLAIAYLHDEGFARAEYRFGIGQVPVRKPESRMFQRTKVIGKDNGILLRKDFLYEKGLVPINAQPTALSDGIERIALVRTPHGSW